MRNSTVLKINGLIFVMGHNGPSLCTLENASSLFYYQTYVQLPAPKLTLLLSKHVNM